MAGAIHNIQMTIHDTAVKLIQASGLINLSRAELCERVGIPDGSFPHYAQCNFTEFIDRLQALGIPEPERLKVTKARTNPALRKDHILNAALTVATKRGYRFLTRDMVAEAAGVSGGLVSRYYDKEALRLAVMELAVERKILRVIAEGIISRNAVALDAPGKLRKEALRSLS